MSNLNLCEEYAQLLEKKAELMRKLAKAARIKQVWPECYGKLGQVELFTTRLGGTGTVPITMRYWIERLEDNEKKEITQEQWEFIHGK